MNKIYCSAKDFLLNLPTDLRALVGLLALLFVFYPDLLLAQSASLTGDHWEQHYPWAFLMKQSIRHGVWPFWTPLIQCGFPIVAESQVGLFYLPNLLLYSLLPIQWAYSYMNLFHFFIAGFGTYLYCRKIGLTPVGAFVAGLVFLFGTGYGGAYYNITSLKTLAWFPWILWTFESFYGTLRKRHLFFTVLFMSLSILAGYLQIAALMLLICAVYFGLRLFFFSDSYSDWKNRFIAGGGMVFAAVAALIIASPQLLLTFELVLFSNRMALSEEYAYVGSLAPMALLTLVFPKLQGAIRGSCIYSGILAIYFITASFFIAGKTLRQMLWLWVVIVLISLLLALGQWSPLFVALVKLTQFHSFRIPAKFLIFVCFSLAILAGMGTHAWIEELAGKKERLRCLNRLYVRLIVGMLLVWGGVYLAFTAGRSSVIQIGEWLVATFIYGKPGHPRTLAAYLDAVNGFANSVVEILSINYPWQIWALVLIAVSFVWVWLMRYAVARPRGAVIYLSLAIFILIVDLYVFAGTDIKKDFDSYRNVLKTNPTIQLLLREKSSGQLGRIFGFQTKHAALPLIPSANILYGIENIGAYSPLVSKRYYETIGQFGNVNDSNSVIASDASFIQERLPLLNALDVSHILSSEVLDATDLHLILHDLSSQTYFYKNEGNRKRAFFVSGPARFEPWSELKDILMAAGFDPQQILLLEDSEENKTKLDFRTDPVAKALKIEREYHVDDAERWMIETTGPGFFVLTNTMYPGWEAKLDGQPTALFPAYGLFQAIFIPGSGKHTLEFSYKPYHGIERFVRRVFLMRREDRC